MSNRQDLTKLIHIIQSFVQINFTGLGLNIFNILINIFLFVLKAFSCPNIFNFTGLGWNTFNIYTICQYIQTLTYLFNLYINFNLFV